MCKNEFCLHLLVIDTEIKSAVPFTITPKMKYLSVSLTNHVMLLTHMLGGMWYWWKR